MILFIGLAKGDYLMGVLGAAGPLLLVVAFFALVAGAAHMGDRRAPLFHRTWLTCLVVGDTLVFYDIMTLYGAGVIVRAMLSGTLLAGQVFVLLLRSRRRRLARGVS